MFTWEYVARIHNLHGLRQLMDIQTHGLYNQLMDIQTHGLYNQLMDTQTNGLA